MAWIFWCADQEIHRSKRNKALPPCFQLMYVGPGTGKPYHVVSLQWSAMGEHFYGFGKEWRPNPYLLRQTYHFFGFRWDENVEESLDINHPFIVYHSWSTYTANLMASFWPDKHWEPRQPTKGADWDWWIFWKRQSVLWRCYCLESWWFFFKDLLWRQIHEVHVAPGTNMKFVICVKVPHTWLIDLVWEAEDCLLSQHIIVHLMECKKQMSTSANCDFNIYRYI